jgi:mitochondrial fission protein ELM1
MVKGISKLLELGVTKKEIIASLAIGDSPAHKYNLIKAAEAPKAIQKMLEQGVISVAKVNAIQRQTTDEAEQIELAVQASQEGRKPKEKKENPVIAVLEEALSLSDPTSAKVATLQAIVRKLKAKASAEDIAKLLK